MRSASDSTVVESDRDAYIRAALMRLPRVQFVAAGDVAGFLRRDVVAAGLDPLDVHVWMVAAGGYEGETYVRRSRMATVSSDCRTPLNPEPYFAVPLEALDARR